MAFQDLKPYTYYKNDKGALFKGDCLELMELIPDKSIDMVLCDLPYGVTKNKWDKIISFDLLWEQYERIIKNKGIIILTAVQPFTSMLLMSNKQLFKYSLIWEKTTPTGFLNANKMPLRIHEDILIFYKKLPTYNPLKTIGHKRKVSTAKHKRNCIKTTNYNEYEMNTYDSTERYPTSILKFATDKQKESLHLNQKPIALFEYLIKTYTDENELVLDNCSGSSTTAISCENTNRKWLCIEKEEEYCEISKNRIIILNKKEK